MNKKYLPFLALLLSLPLFAQQQPAGGQQPAGAQPAPQTREKQDEDKSFLKVLTLEDFEEAEDWKARATSPLGNTKTLKLVQRGPIQSADNRNEMPPVGPPGKGEQCDVNLPECAKNPNHILGVKTYFADRGFDRVEALPPHDYIIKGRVRQFSIWALGRKFRHTLSIKLKDYRNKIHKLEFGNLDYFGWRKMTLTVPGWLPQSQRFSMLDKNLRFAGLFVTSDVHEIPGEFYFYVDNLKVMVDQSEADYPGSEISDNW